MEELIPIIAILCTIGLPIATGLVLGYKKITSEHTERMGLINQGIIPPDSPKKKANPNRFVSLRNGIILICLGIGILVGFFISNYYDEYMTDSFFTIGASIVIFLGIGYLIYFFVTQKMQPNEEDKTNLNQE